MIKFFDKKEKDFETNDYGLASTLKCMDYQVKNLKDKDTKRVTFVFEAKSGIQKVVDDYWQGKIRVEPVKFNNARRELKSMIINY